MESTATGSLDAPSPFPLEGPTARVFRRVGLFLFLLAAVLPYHGCRVHPAELSGDEEANKTSFDPSYPGVSGAAYAENLLRRLQLLDPMESSWGKHEGKYGDFMGPRLFLALPFWLAALLLIRGNRPRMRTVVGTVLWVLLGVAFIAMATYGRGAFRSGTVELGYPEAPWFWPLESPWIWLGIAGGLLLLRPRRRWEIRDVEATVESQALLGWGLCLVTPAWQAWSWAFQEGHPLPAITRALWANYRSGFWLALAALALIAAPLFASEDFLRRMYDCCSPWRKRPSSPVPSPP